MSLNKEDAARVGYKAEIEWYRERIAALSTGFVNPSVDASKDPDPEDYRNILDDLYKKADKLDKRIDAESKDLKIPVDKEKDPDIYQAVSEVDSTSKGEYISYNLYKMLLEQVEAGKNNINIDDIIENSSNDIFANSDLIQDRLYSGYASYVGSDRPEDGPGDNSAERYINRYLNNILNWNEHDYKIRQIINFSDNYLGTFPDPSFIPWSFKQDTLFEKATIGSYKNLWNNFSEIGKGELKRFGGAFKDLAALRPDKNIASLTDRYIDYTNKFLNGLDNLLNTTWTPALICCFVKYTTKLSPKTLKAIRAMLQLLQTGINFEFNDILNSFRDIFNNIIRGLLMDQLMGFIRQILQRLVDPIKRWINNPDDPNWQKVFDCLPVRQLIEMYMTRAVDFVEKWIENWLYERYKDLELEHIFKDAKLSQGKENKWIGRALKIIDTVIAAMELSAYCGMNGTPADEDVQRILNDYSLLNVPNYTYPNEDNPNIYNSFITMDQQKAIEEGVLSKSIVTQPRITGQLTTADASQIERESGVGDCSRMINAEDMPKEIVWIEEEMRKSQERQ